MKKLIILSWLLLLALLLVGCNSVPKPTKASTDAGETEPMSTEKSLTTPLPWEHSLYYVLLDEGRWTGNTSKFARFDSIDPFFDFDDTDLNIAQKVSVSFAGHELTGELNDFSMDRDSSSPLTPRFEYKVTNKNDEGIVKFCTDEKGQVLAAYADKEVVDFLYNPLERKSIQQLKEIADKFIKDNLSYYNELYDFNLIDVVDQSNLDLFEAQRRYSFTYAKFIDGIETAERIFVEFNINGILSCYETNFLMKVKTEVDISKVDMVKVRTKVDEALNTIFFERFDEYNAEQNEVKFLGIYILDDSTLGAYYHVNVRSLEDVIDDTEHYMLVEITPSA